MKVSKLKRHIRCSSVKQPEQGGGFIVDEFHLLAASAGGVLPRPSTRPGARTLIVTQSIERNKHGKRVFLGATRDAATGLSFCPRPKKFLPAQVLRRQVR